MLKFHKQTIKQKQVLVDSEHVEIKITAPDA